MVILKNRNKGIITMAGIYCADIYCDDCIEDIKEKIAIELWESRDYSDLPDGLASALFEDCKKLKEALDSMNKRDYDSDEYPKYCSGEKKSNSPQHCGGGANCLNSKTCSDGEKYGYFFENNLTTKGSDYVKEAVNDALVDGRTDVAVELWMPCYDYINYHEECACGTYDDLDENNECGDCSEVFLVCNGCGDNFPCDDVDEDNYCKDCAKNSRPCEGDFTITPCGPLCSKSGVGRVEGEFIGEFHSDDEAIMAIRWIMNDEKFWPNIWIISDRGNWSLYIENP